MKTSTILNSIAVVTLALALSACGRKSDVKTEAAKPENPFAMKEASAPTPTQAPSGDAAAAATSQAEGTTDAKNVASAGTNSVTPGAIAAPTARRLSRATQRLEPSQPVDSGQFGEPRDGAVTVEKRAFGSR